MFAVTFPTQIRYLTESESSYSGLICGCNPLRRARIISQITAQMSHLYINTAQGVANSRCKANVSIVISESPLSSQVHPHSSYFEGFSLAFL